MTQIDPAPTKGTLHLRVGSPFDVRLEGIAVDVVPLRAGLSAKHLDVAVGQDTTLEVEAGDYLIEARLPSGAVASATCSVTPASTSEALLPLPAPPHEWLAFTRLVARPERADRRARYDSQPWRPRTPADVQAGMAIVSARGEAWACPDGQSFVEPPGGRGRRVLCDLGTDERLSSCILRPDAGWPYTYDEQLFLRITPPCSQSSLLVLPVPWFLDAQLAPLQVLWTGGRIPAVIVQDPGVGAVLAYLDSGDTAAARRSADAIADKAERILFDKVKNPVAAAGGAYVLLRLGQLAKLHDWVGNLAAWYPALPDGAILRATQLLRTSPAAEVKEEVTRLLVRAAQGGYPVYTEGVRLLASSLRLLASDDAPAPQVADALKAAQSMEAHASADSMFTWLDE